MPREKYRSNKSAPYHPIRGFCPKLARNDDGQARAARGRVKSRQRKSEERGEEGVWQVGHERKASNEI